MLSALLGSEFASSTRIVAKPEVRGDSGRYDILVARETNGLLSLTIIELKVAADQGENQLPRYLTDTQSKRFLQSSFPEFSTRRLEGTPELVYLTISKEEVPFGITSLTYRELQERIDIGNPDNADVSELDWLLFRDVLTHLVTEYGTDVEFLSNLNAATTLEQIRASYSSERSFLKKKLAARITEVVLENLSLGEGWETYSYAKPRGGRECGFYRAQWSTEASEKYPGWELHFNTDDLMGMILQSRARTFLHVQFVPNPYDKRDVLSDSERAWFKPTQVALGESIRGQMNGTDRGSSWQIMNHKWQFVRAVIEINSGDSLRQLATKYWQAAAQLTPMIDQAVESVIGE